MPPMEPALLIAGILLFAGVAASRLSDRLGVPALLLFLLIGLRGAVPIVLATFPASYGIRDADTIFDLVFCIVLTSMLVQGLTLVPCARWLGVAEREGMARHATGQRDR